MHPAPCQGIGPPADHNGIRAGTLQIGAADQHRIHNRRLTTDVIQIFLLNLLREQTKRDEQVNRNKYGSLHESKLKPEKDHSFIKEMSTDPVPKLKSFCGDSWKLSVAI
jgi:hypothetical protein